MKNDPSIFELNKLRLLRKELGQVYKDKEAYWEQKSRALWLQEGDKSTSFFHIKMIQRCKYNNIKGIILDDGCWLSDHRDILIKVERFYKNLFTTSDLRI